MEKNQKIEKKYVFLILIDFGGRSPGQIRWIQKIKNTPRACGIASQLKKSMKFHVRVNQFSLWFHEINNFEKKSKNIFVMQYPSNSKTKKTVIFVNFDNSV